MDTVDALGQKIRAGTLTPAALVEACLERIAAVEGRVMAWRLVDAEGRIDTATRAGLAARGHQVNVLDDWSLVVGGGQGIARDPDSGAWMAGADPRRDGYALAV